MDAITKLEAAVAGWHQKLPHLPTTARRWLADNSWWMILAAVIIGGLTVVGVLTPLLFAGMLFVGLGGAIGIAISGLLAVLVLFWLGLTIVSVVLMALAVSPLKRLEKRGWSLIFAVLLVNLAAVVLKLLFDFEAGSFIAGALGTAIAGYFLLEIREYFTVAREATIVAPVDLAGKEAPAK